MTMEKDPITNSDKSDPDISTGFWHENLPKLIVLIFVLVVAVFFYFAGPFLDGRVVFQVGWFLCCGCPGATFLICLILFIGATVWEFIREFFYGGRMPGLPLKMLNDGDAAGAERYYQMAVAYWAGIPDIGTFCEFARYLICRGRDSEAKAMYEEILAVLSKQSVVGKWINYYAFHDCALYFISKRDFETGRRLLEWALDTLPALKMDGSASPIIVELLLRLSLVDLFLRINDLNEARLHMERARPLPEKFGSYKAQVNSRVGLSIFGAGGAVAEGEPNYLCDLVLARECLLNCAIGSYDVAHQEIAKVREPKPWKPWFWEGLLSIEVNVMSMQVDFMWIKGRIHLARHELVKAEENLRQSISAGQIAGVPARPESLEPRLDLAECLFAQAKHDEAFAAFQEARAIVADFALPTDALWQAALATWSQRARELGKTELLAILEADVQNAAATPNPAITILEKFRIHPRKAE